MSEAEARLAEDRRNRQAAQRGKRQILTDNLHDCDNNRSGKHDIMAVLELFRNYLGSGGVRFNVVVVPRLAVQDKYGDEQTNQQCGGD